MISHINDILINTILKIDFSVLEWFGIMQRYGKSVATVAIQKIGLEMVKGLVSRGYLGSKYLGIRLL